MGLGVGVLRSFRPLAPTQNLPVTAVAQTLTLADGVGTRAVRLVNVGTQTIFLAFVGATESTATLATSIPLPAGQTEVFTIGNDVTGISAIANASGSTLYATVGEGL